MSTQRGKLLPFWRNVPVTRETDELAYDPQDALPPPAPNMEQLAKNIELARAHKVECEGELMKADGLLNRCIDEYEKEEIRRGLKSRK